MISDSVFDALHKHRPGDSLRVPGSVSATSSVSHQGTTKPSSGPTTPPTMQHNSAHMSHGTPNLLHTDVIPSKLRLQT